MKIESAYNHYTIMYILNKVKKLDDTFFCNDYETLSYEKLSSDKELQRVLNEVISTTGLKLLNNAVRVKKHKAKNKKTRVDLTADAHFLLSEKAKKEGLTLSEVITKYIKF